MIEAPVLPLTVVVVTYNHSDFVVANLDSIAAQSMPPQRVVVVDDCSPDDTAAVVRDWIERMGSPYELVVNSENRGLCATLNQALRDVDTPYFAYISGDDLMMPQHLEAQHSLLSGLGETYAAVYCDAVRIDRSGKSLTGLFSETYDWPSRERRSGEIFSELLEHNWIPAPAVLLRTSAVRAVGGYDDEIFYEDFDLWLRLSDRYRFGLSARPQVYFRELETSLGHQEFRADNPRFLGAYVRIFLKHAGRRDSLGGVVRGQLWIFSTRLWGTGRERRLAARGMRRSWRDTSRPAVSAILAAGCSAGIGGGLIAKMRPGRRRSQRAEEVVSGQ